MEKETREERLRELISAIIDYFEDEYSEESLRE